MWGSRRAGPVLVAYRCVCARGGRLCVSVVGGPGRARGRVATRRPVHVASLFLASLDGVAGAHSWVGCPVVVKSERTNVR